MRRLVTLALAGVCSVSLLHHSEAIAQPPLPEDMEEALDALSGINEMGYSDGRLGRSPKEFESGDPKAAYLDGYKKGKAEFDAERAERAWDAAPKVADSDGKGFTKHVGNVTRGIRDDGFTYVWATDGDWEYYQDSSGVVGARYHDRARGVTRFQFGVPANGGGTFRDVAIYQSGKMLFQHRLSASFAAKGCLIGGVTGRSGMSVNLKRGWPPPPATKKQKNRGGPGGMGFRQVGPYQVPNMAFGPNQ